MKIEDIIALTQAGFTKDEIMALTTGEEAPQSDEIEEPSKQTSEKAALEPSPVDSKIDALVEKLEKLSSGMEALALRNTRMPERETTEEALAKIINPYIDTGTGGIDNGSK